VAVKPVCGKNYLKTGVKDWADTKNGTNVKSKFGRYIFASKVATFFNQIFYSTGEFPWMVAVATEKLIEGKTMKLYHCGGSL
jgi:hypothetical protein